MVHLETKFPYEGGATGSLSREAYLTAVNLDGMTPFQWSDMYGSSSVWVAERSLYKRVLLDTIEAFVHPTSSARNRESARIVLFTSPCNCVIIEDNERYECDGFCLEHLLDFAGVDIEVEDAHLKLRMLVADSNRLSALFSKWGLYDPDSVYWYEGVCHRCGVVLGSRMKQPRKFCHKCAVWIRSHGGRRFEVY